jgi:hypothetical protein
MCEGERQQLGWGGLGSIDRCVVVILSGTPLLLLLSYGNRKEGRYYFEVLGTYE